MTARERIVKCLTFSSPDRVPRDLWTLPAVLLFQGEEYDALLGEYPVDIQRSQVSPGSSDRMNDSIRETGSYRDEWGSTWSVGEPGVVGEVKGPALDDWSALDTYRRPWHLIRDRDLSRVDRAYDESERFVLSDAAARPFERLQFLRGSENLFVDIGYGTVEFRRLLDMVHEFYLEDIAGWCRSNVDGILFIDDWGSNHSLLISPDTWREIFKPLYRDYCDAIHRAGKFAFFHSDGFIEPIYSDLIEVGVDAINSQLFTMDIESLARQYRGRITFWGEIDRQGILPFGTPDDVRDAVRRVRLALDDGSGGVIAQCEWGKYNLRANIEAVFEAWSGPGPMVQESRS